MAHPKTIPPRCHLLIGLLLIGLFGAGPAPAADWQTYTSFRQVSRLRLIDDTVFAVTSGGLLGLTNPNQPGRVWMQDDGLGTTEITDIMSDSDGARWLTGAGRLVRITPDEIRQFPTGPVYGELDLRTVEDDNDQLWLGSDSGLVLFSKTIDGGQFQNRFRITSINPFPAVNDILLIGDSIWLATEAGIAVADRSDPVQLVSPLNWTMYDMAQFPSLDSDNIRCLNHFEGTVYVGAAEGFYELDIAGPSPSLTAIPVIGSGEVTDLTINNDTLFVYSTTVLAFVKNSAIISLGTDGLGSPPVTGVRTSSVAWAALAAGGLWQNSTGVYTEYPFTGLPENNVADVTVSSNGRVFALLDTRGAAELINGQWYLFNYDVGSRSTKAITDSAGGIWFGSFGEGAWRLINQALTQYDAANTTVRPAFGDFVALSGLVSSSSHIFMSVTDPIDGYSVAFARLNSLDNPAAWDSIGIPEGLNDNKVIDLTYGGGQLVAATDANGLYICSPFSDPITCDHITRQENRITSDVTRVARYAPDGALWIGTNFGISREAIELGLPLWEDIPLPVGFGPDITALEIDSRGNAWIGSRTGLAFRDAGSGAVEIYTTENSPLVGNDIRGLAIDPVTGDLFVATTQGLSQVPSIFGAPTADVENILAFPNPFVIATGDERLQFNFSRAGSVRIFTVAGDLVTEIDVNAGWDGRNQSGREAASGVYLFVVTTESGDIGRGKFLMVRQ